MTYDTFGIDISGSQRGFNVALAVAAGNEFCGVKAVASYRPEHTVADQYHEHIDSAIAAGLDAAKFHYATVNSQNTPAETADFFYDNRYRPAPTDAYMFDNEPLDAYKVFWDDDGCAEAIIQLRRRGIFYSQIWLYCPAALTRSKQWPRVQELRKLGVKIVWVSYGDNDPYLEDGEEPFTGMTGLDDPELHQFTSSYRVPGWGGNLDRNASRLSVAELFKEGSPMVYDPFSNMRTTGTWEDHASYSAGGTDKPTAYGSLIPAPASGTLQINGGSGEFACGWVGTAGRRSILHLDTPLERKLPRRPSPPEGEGPMVAIVFQHQSAFGAAGWHPEGAPVGRTGASASGRDWGGDVHLHWHGLNARGQRLRLESFITGYMTAGGGGRPIIPPATGVAEMYLFNGISNPEQYYLATYEGRILRVKPVLGIEAKILLGAEPKIPRGQLTDAELVDLCAQGGYTYDGQPLYDGTPGLKP